MPAMHGRAAATGYLHTCIPKQVRVLASSHGSLDGSVRGGANGRGRVGPLFRKVLERRAPPAPQMPWLIYVHTIHTTAPSTTTRGRAKPVVQALRIRSINALERRRHNSSPTPSGPGLLHGHCPMPRTGEHAIRSCSRASQLATFLNRCRSARRRARQCSGKPRWVRAGCLAAMYSATYNNLT